MVTGPVVIDSRRVGSGGLFAAVEGERVDGHDYAARAHAAGAVAMLGTRPAGVPGLIVDDVPGALAKLAQAVMARLPQATIAGLTGSAGKTSTKDLTAQLVERLGPTISPEGSYNNEFGFPLTVLRADEQTRYLVLELAARGPGHIAYLCEIVPPRVGAVLNVGHAHTGEFGGVEQVARAKGELPAALPAAAGRRGSDPERRRSPGAGHGRPDRGPDRLVRAGPRGRLRRRGHPAERPRPAIVHADHPGRAGSGPDGAARRPPGAERAGRRRDRRPSWAWTPKASPTACPPPRHAAGGGWRSGRRRAG